MNTENKDFLLEELAALNEEVPPMPEDFHQGWIKKVEKDMANKQKKPMTTVVTRILSAAAALVFVVGGSLMAQRSLDLSGGGEQNTAVQFARSTSMGSAAYDSYDSGAGDMVSYGKNNVMLTSDMAVEESGPAAAEKKIIRTASMTIATQEWETSFDALKALCTDMGGWIASASENTASSGLRTAYLTLRVPSERLDEFLESSSGAGRVTRRDESATDVTESYQDTQARLNTQQALMARLQALVTEAASLSDLLALEAQIADTQYMVDSLQSSLNATDRQVDYAAVDITLKEEKPSAVTEEDISLMERLGLALEAGFEAFGDFLEGAAIFIVTALPFAGVALLVWFVVRWICHFMKKRRNS